MYEEKKNEIDESLQEIDYQINKHKAEMGEAEEYEKRIEQFRKLLSQNQELETFEKAIFESVIDTVIIGGKDKSNEPDPAIITFVYKAGINKSENYEGKKVTSAKCFDQSEKLPDGIELFEFSHPYKHIVFNKIEQDVIQKRLKDYCQVKVMVKI